MKTLLFTFCVLLALFQTTAMLKSNDLDRLTGKKWFGTLTYLDYSTNKIEPIETRLAVTRSDKGAGIYNFLTEYPKEASHNSTDEIVISRDGTQIDGETLKERILKKDGTLRFVTTKEGSDDNKKAFFRFTYVIGTSSYSRKKEVCYAGSTAWFTRNDLNLKAN